MSQEKPKVLVLDPQFPEIACNILKKHCEVTICQRATRDELLEKVKGMHGLLWSPPQLLDKEILEATGDQLKVISAKSAGFDHIDLEEVQRRGISMFNASGVSNCTTAELAVGLAIAAGRNFHHGRLKIER